MRILSNFKDYYDYVANIYSDPKIIYDRPLKNKTYIDFKYNDKTLPHIMKKIFILNNNIEKEKYDNLNVLIIGNRLFTILNKKNTSKVLSEEYLIKFTSLKYRYYYDKEYKNINNFVNFTDDKLINICRKTKMPVMLFGIDNRDKIFYLERFCPILNNYGISKYISPEKIYQEISYIVGNLIYESPDLKPPVEISDKDKILKAGFDLKTSFRGK